MEASAAVTTYQTMVDTKVNSVHVVADVVVASVAVVVAVSVAAEVVVNVNSDHATLKIDKYKEEKI